MAVYISHAGFSLLLQCPVALAMLATPSFPCVTSPRVLLMPCVINHMQQTTGFSVHRVFRSHRADRWIDKWHTSYLADAASGNLPTLLTYCSAMTQNGKRIVEAHLSHYTSTYNRVQTNQPP